MLASLGVCLDVDHVDKGGGSRLKTACLLLQGSDNELTKLQDTYIPVVCDALGCQAAAGGGGSAAVAGPRLGCERVAALVT